LHLKDYGLKVDGIVGNQTLTTLKTADAQKDMPDFVRNPEVENAKKASAGGIKDDAILMSS
jgi:hypothetical protein